MGDSETKIKTCLKIQWKTLHIENGKPACPSCGEEAELILGVFANPCWGHKIKEEEDG